MYANRYGRQHNMYGPRRYLNFNSTYRFDDHSGIEAGVSFLKEQYRTFTSGTPDSTTWYDNNRQDYHVKYFGFDDKNDYEFQVYYDRLGKESRTSRGGNWTGFDHAKYETTVTEAKNTYRPMRTMPSPLAANTAIRKLGERVLAPLKVTTG